jgi:hypothetical protein
MTSRSGHFCVFKMDSEILKKNMFHIVPRTNRPEKIKKYDPSGVFRYLNESFRIKTQKNHYLIHTTYNTRKSDSIIMILKIEVIYK